MLCGQQYGAPRFARRCAGGAGGPAARHRGPLAPRGYAQTGTLATGPAWCWLTAAGMKATGLGYPATRPSLGRLAHIRAVLAVRLWLEGGRPIRTGQAWWRSERRIRAATGGPASGVHVPDAEIHWPSLDGSPYAGQIWAIEAELTAKPLARTASIMQNLLARTSDYGPGGRAGPGRPVRPGDLPDRPAGRPGGDSRGQRAARAADTPGRGPRPARRSHLVSVWSGCGSPPLCGCSANASSWRAG